MSTRKLLLADDSVTIQKVVNLTFADEGIEVVTVGDGDSAMEKLAEISPDLVLADVNMPGLNGYQVCERIKNDANFRHIPVILLVGSFEPFDEEEARRVGAEDFLTKPFQSIRQLVGKVTSLLDANDKNESSPKNTVAASSFADTLDMNKPENSESKTDEFGDAGMDDELIQANPVGNFALDESAKFETKEVAESFDDPGKTQPLSVYDLKDFNFVPASAENEMRSAENADENQPEAQSPETAEISADDFDAPDSTGFSSYLDSSDDDLLEIPFDEEEDFDEEDEETADRFAPTEPAVEENERAEIENYESPNQPTESKEFEAEPDEYYGANETVVGSLLEPAPEELQTAETTENSGEFSPELIEAIADRVIAKLSDQIIREIAWEVVPPHADLIIKKMVEEKLREQ